MQADDDGDVGALALAETTLGELVKEILRTLPGQRLTRPGATTNQSAMKLRGYASRRPDLIPDRTEAWLDHVLAAVTERNEVFHAKALDRCIKCGNATHFQHNDKDVDRSPQRVRSLTTRIDDLTREGIGIARSISTRLNESYVRDARSEAAKTGRPQSPPQVLIGSTSFQCATCSGTGVAALTIEAPTAVMVLPHGTDLSQLFGAQPAKSPSPPGSEADEEPGPQGSFNDDL